MGITGAVYASIRYLLPLVLPFFISYGIALFLRRPVLWMHRHIAWTWRGKRHGFPIALAAFLLLLWLTGLFAAFSYLGACKLLQEMKRLSEAFPQILAALDAKLTGSCSKIEELFHIRKGLIPALLREGITDVLANIRRAAMPYLVGNSVNWFQKGVRGLLVFLVTMMASVLSLQEMDAIRKRRDRSLFREEFAMIGERIVNVGRAYLKTQGLIMAATIAICSLGLFLLGNPYYLLAAVSIGFLDALPVFGTGTVFVPWILIEMFQKDWKEALFLLLIYLVCYFVREGLEAKMMGSEVGLTPLETLMAIYVGLLLFGLWGFLLGPLGLLIIEDFVKSYERLAK
ncbi:MAG: AI-2E family transporter [bacterium]|nr:AI-2E family transporter [bacterium]